MRKIVVTEFVSLDGVIEEPQNWSFPYWDDDIAKVKHDELFESDAQLLGRITYEGFAASWPERKDEGGYAHRINDLPKYVVSESLKKAEWNNSHIINKNILQEIAKLKEEEGKVILIHGSATLVNKLLQAGLIDEIRLLVYPIVLGKGKRLFWEETEAKLELVKSKSFSKGVVLLTYTPKI